MIKTAVVGATGYSGLELVRLLHKHPHAKICMVTSTTQEGQELAHIYPQLNSINHKVLTEFNLQKLEGIDLVFFATPSGVSTRYIPEIVDMGIKCIDLSGDFRLDSPGDYGRWYQHQPPTSNYLNQAAYGLTEFFAEQIQSGSIIANPGCYPTASLLGLLPALMEDMIDVSFLVIDGKSGVSGAGRSVSLGTHYSEVNENLKAYKLGTHQHIPEIEQISGKLTGKQINVNFSTHLIPLTRGMMCTIYGRLIKSITTEILVQFYQEYYQEHPFIRVRPVGSFPTVKEVAGSNFCDIGLMVDQRTNSLIIVSVIDNLVKGASGQAIQNMNVLFDLPQTTGLVNVPIYP